MEFKTWIDGNILFFRLFKKIFEKADAFVVLGSSFKKKLEEWGFRQAIFVDTTTVDDDLLEGFSLSGKVTEIKGSGKLKILFISRLLFDGGYFEKSIDILKTGNISDYRNTEDRCEFYYRYARNYQSLSDYEDAIDFYYKVIEISGSEEFYFWGNATLNLGHIYTKKRSYAQAREYYKLALKYNGDSYQNSIKTEAKAGLKKISGF